MHLRSYTVIKLLLDLLEKTFKQNNTLNIDSSLQFVTNLPIFLPRAR